MAELTLPDLSAASESVRAQLKEKFDFVSSTRAGGTTAELATAYGDIGVLLMAAGYYDSAETAFQLARSGDPGDPKDPRWPYYLGHVYRLRSQPELSAEAFSVARALRPDDVTTMVWLGEAQMSAGRPEAAEAVLIEAERLAPQDARVLAALGRAALARRDYAAAVARLEAALQAEPRADALHYQLSLAYRGAGDAVKADAALERRGTTELQMRDPLLEMAAALDSASMYDMRSRTALQRGDWSSAIAEARRGLALAGTSPTVRGALHHRLGTALAQTGDAAGADREFRASVEVSNLPRAHYSLGILRLSSGDLAAALREFSLALEADPSYLAARLTRADALRRSDRAREALLEYERALQADPRSPAVQFGLALTLGALGRDAEARELLARATHDHPEDRALKEAFARLLAASPDERVRDPARALAIIDPVVRSGASFESVETMARALAGLGRFDEAVSLQRDAILQARATNQQALATAMEDTERLYRQRRLPRRTWRTEPMYEPTP